MRISTLLVCLITFISSLSLPALAADLTLKSGGVVLKTYTDNDLSSMPQATINTELPWLDGENQFTGVRLEDLSLSQTPHCPN